MFFQALHLSLLIMISYLYYYLLSKTRKILDDAAGAAQPNISPKQIANYVFINRSTFEMENISNELNTLNNAIKTKKSQLLSLDELVKSRFIEMFIDKGFPNSPIRELVDRKIVTAKKGHSINDKIKYIDISSIDNQKNEIVSFTEYVLSDAPSRAQQCLKVDDILISTVRPNLKNIAINKYNETNIVGSSGFCVLRASKCNPFYLMHCVLSDDFTTEMVALTSGASYPAIRDNDVLDYKVINAPISLQNEFAEFVKLIDKSKFVCQFIQGTFYAKFARFRPPP